MNTIPADRKKAPLPVAILLSTLLTLPLLNSCGGGSRTAAPPVNDSVGRTVNDPGQPQARKGLSTGQKVAILGGAAALWYLYNRHKNAQGTGPEGQYYRSKDGRIYYRDAQHRPHYVTPPAEGIRVPESEAQQYRDYQGYNGSTSGRSLPSY